MKDLLVYEIRMNPSRTLAAPCVPEPLSMGCQRQRFVFQGCEMHGDASKRALRTEKDSCAGKNRAPWRSVLENTLSDPARWAATSPGEAGPFRPPLPGSPCTEPMSGTVEMQPGDILRQGVPKRAATWLVSPGHRANPILRTLGKSVGRGL